MSQAIVVDAPGHFRLVQTKPPKPGPGEALVRIAAAGLCGSDRELYEGARPREFVEYPIIPGHEWSGTVMAADNKSLIGAKVVGEGYRGCQHCERCREGSPNLCLNGYDETGFTRPGAFANHLLLPTRLLHVLPTNADLRAAALLEPAAVIASAVRHVSLRPGEKAAVIGAGTLGMLALGFLAASSPSRLVAIEPRKGRAEPARAAGATETCQPGEADKNAFDVVIETAGAKGTAAEALALARRGGRVALTGITGDPDDSVPTTLLVTQALEVRTIFGAGPADWAYAVRAFSAGVLRPKPLITHELPLAEFEKALKLSAAPDTGKVLLRPDLEN